MINSGPVWSIYTGGRSLSFFTTFYTTKKNAVVIN